MSNADHLRSRWGAQSSLSPQPSPRFFTIRPPHRALFFQPGLGDSATLRQHPLPSSLSQSIGLVDGDAKAQDRRRLLTCLDSPLRPASRELGLRADRLLELSPHKSTNNGQPPGLSGIRSQPFPSAPALSAPSIRGGCLVAVDGAGASGLLLIDSTASEGYRGPRDHTKPPLRGREKACGDPMCRFLWHQVPRPSHRTHQPGVNRSPVCRQSFPQRGSLACSWGRRAAISFLSRPLSHNAHFDHSASQRHPSELCPIGCD